MAGELEETRLPFTMVASLPMFDLDELRSAHDALWSAIGRACTKDDFRPSPGPLCNWCSYQAYCPAYGGDPLQAMLDRPHGICLGEGGAIYLGDTLNHRVRRVVSDRAAQ